MGKRYWRKAREGEQCDVFSPAVVEVTREELLAEMPTEAVLREAAKRMAERGWEHTSVLLDQQAALGGEGGRR